MIFIAQLTALVGILGVGIVYGTDVFSALVLRPALSRVDNHVLVAVMGNVHRFGDRRMPVPGAIGLIAAAVTVLLVALGGEAARAVAAGVALVVLIVWTALYARISAPLNRILIACADENETPDNARELQADWDRIIVLRATLQGLAILALGISLFI